MKRIMTALLALILLLTAIPMAAAAAGNVYVGQEFYFGAYEQDGDASNGPEPICWIVLNVDARSQTALVASKFGLETMPYNDHTGSTSWHNSLVRQWLNIQFFYGSFNSAERPYVVETTVSSSKDMVFLLDESQIKKHFDSELLFATPHAKQTGAYVADDNGCSSWWVRQNKTSTYGKFVGAHGKFYSKGNKVTVDDNVLRPAMNVSYTAVTGVPDIPLVPDPGVLAVTKMEIQTRSGPSTQYDGLGGYYDQGGYPVWVISKAADNGGVWWLQVEFPYGGKTVRVYTGLKRVDVNLNAIPDDPDPIGQGAVTADCKAYYGPGTHYKAHKKEIPEGTSGEVLSTENGWVWLEFRNSKGKSPRRVWLPEDCIRWTAY